MMTLCPHCSKSFKKLKQHLHSCTLNPELEQYRQNKDPQPLKIIEDLSNNEAYLLIGKLTVYKESWDWLSEESKNAFAAVIKDLTDYVAKKGEYEKR